MARSVGSLDRFGLLSTEVLAPDDIADGVAYMVTRPRHTTIGELWIRTSRDHIRRRAPALDFHGDRRQTHRHAGPSP
jgi:hypothetical protein